MKEINLNSLLNVKLTLFPDNQPHIQIENVEEFDSVKLVVSLTSSKKVLEMVMVANAIGHKHAFLRELHIPYLMGARYDRLMNDGDSLDLEVIGSVINLCNAEKVYLYDPHSSAVMKHIKNIYLVDNRKLLREYDTPNAVYIVPDKGADKKTQQQLEFLPNVTEIVRCDKSRELSTGRITISVLEPEKCEGRDCVIVDDLCDGGGTFLGIASQINPRSLTLIVTHGIFSKGFKELEEKFSQIITSNTYASSYNSSIVKIVELI